MFRLNEAPKKALAAIDKANLDRGCGMFWSIVCCLPTFGASVGLCDNGQGDWACCYPRSVPVTSDVTLSVLIEKLNQVRITKEQLRQNSNVDQHQVVEWQVKETIKLLQKAVNDNRIQGSYKTAINQVLQVISTQARDEEENGLLMATEKSPLNEQPYVPSYGFTKK